MAEAATNSKMDVSTIEDTQDAVENLGYLANHELHQETVWQACTRYPKRTFWLTYAIWVLLISGFDNTASSTVLSIPRFRQEFGSPFGGNYVLPATWQSAILGGPGAAAIISALSTSYLADRVGRKPLYLSSFIFAFIGITLETVSNGSCAMFFGGKFMSGVATGGFVTISLTYIGEFSPVAIRGIMSAAAPISGSLSQLIVSLLQNAYGEMDSSWAYKSLFMAQYAITFTAVVIWPFLPESPWYLVRQGKYEEAASSCRRLGLDRAETEKSIANIKLTYERNMAETESSTFLECFRKSNLRRTIISVTPFTIQAFCGIIFLSGYSIYYMQLAGYSTKESYRLGIAQQVLCIVGNVSSWFMIDWVGRRNLMICGLSLLTAILFITGGLAVAATPGCVRGTVAMILLFVCLYNATIGAASYTVLSEISTPRLRSKTVSIAIVFQSSFDIMWAFIIPYLFNPNEANLGAKTTFIFGGFSIIFVGYLVWYHPETRGRSFQELDEMFTDGIPTGKFKSYITSAERIGKEIKKPAQGREETI